MHGLALEQHSTAVIIDASLKVRHSTLPAKLTHRRKPDLEPAAKLVENVGEQTVNLPPAGGMVVVAGTPGLVLASVVLLTPPIASHVTR